MQEDVAMPTTTSDAVMSRVQLTARRETTLEQHTHTHTRLMALFRDYPGEPVAERQTNLDFTEARDSE